jgi:putative phage tail protein
MNGHALATPIMMQLGAFQFGINTAAYQGLSRSDEWRWPDQERFGQAPALQYTGPGATTITLDGILYPEWRGGLGQLDAMRAEAGRGKPLVLVDGRGQALGMWVIERVDESQSIFAAGGVARRIEFTLQLKRFSARVAGPVPRLPPLPKPASTPAAGADAVAQARAVAANTATSAGSVASTAAGAWQSLQRAVSPAAAWIREAAGAAQRVAETAGQLQGEARAAIEALQGVPGTGRALDTARRLVDRAGRFRARASSASDILQRSVRHLDDTPTEAAAAVLSALASSNRLGATCRQLARDAARIIEGKQP